MGAPDAPGWLLPAFVRSVIAIGATAPREQIEAEGAALIGRWSSADRHFHCVPHLVAVLERVDTLAQETHHPDLVRIAAWYHGAVFDTSMLRQYRRAAGENKPESAELAFAHLTALGVPETVARRVHELIMNLVSHDASRVESEGDVDVDARALCDADLGTLAADPQRYKTYRQRVRAEFEHVPVRDYLEARIAIATKLLARRELFSSPLAADWEAPARQNLEAELAQLRSELAKLPPRPEGEEPIPEAPPTPRKAAIASEEIPAGSAAEHHHTPVTRFARDASTGVTRPVVSSISDVGAPALPASEPAELVGVPFEERRTVVDPEEVQPSSGIEQAPVEPATLPRRIPVAKKQEAAEAERAVRALPSTTPEVDDQATGSLFRPIE